MRLKRMTVKYGVDGLCADIVVVSCPKPAAGAQAAAQSKGYMDTKRGAALTVDGTEPLGSVSNLDLWSCLLFSFLMSGRMA